MMPNEFSKQKLKVSDESLGRDETSFVRLTTNNVFSQVTVNFINDNRGVLMANFWALIRREAINDNNSYSYNQRGIG